MWNWIKNLFTREEETPTITYKIADDLHILRVQDGHGDPYPKYVLWRKINKKWYNRGHIYCEILPNVKEALGFLLRQETMAYTIQKL